MPSDALKSRNSENMMRTKLASLCNLYHTNMLIYLPFICNKSACRVVLTSPSNFTFPNRGLIAIQDYKVVLKVI